MKKDDNLPKIYYEQWKQASDTGAPKQPCQQWISSVPDLIDNASCNLTERATRLTIEIGGNVYLNIMSSRNKLVTQELQDSQVNNGSALFLISVTIPAAT